MSNHAPVFLYKSEKDYEEGKIWKTLRGNVTVFCDTDMGKFPVQKLKTCKGKIYIIKNSFSFYHQVVEDIRIFFCPTCEYIWLEFNKKMYSEDQPIFYDLITPTNTEICDAPDKICWICKKS